MHMKMIHIISKISKTHHQTGWAIYLHWVGNRFITGNFFELNLTHSIIRVSITILFFLVHFVSFVIGLRMCGCIDLCMFLIYLFVVFHKMDNCGTVHKTWTELAWKFYFRYMSFFHSYSRCGGCSDQNVTIDSNWLEIRTMNNPYVNVIVVFHLISSWFSWPL